FEMAGALEMRTIHTQATSVSAGFRPNADPLATLKSIVLVGKCSLTLLTFARSCRRHGIAPYLVEVTDDTPQLRSFSAAIGGGIAVSSEALRSTAGIEIIRNFADTVKASALVPDCSINVREMAAQRSTFEPACRVLAPSAEALAIEDDKLRQIALARECGF